MMTHACLQALGRLIPGGCWFQGQPGFCNKTLFQREKISVLSETGASFQEQLPRQPVCICWSPLRGLLVASPCAKPSCDPPDVVTGLVTHHSPPQWQDPSRKTATSVGLHRPQSQLSSREQNRSVLQQNPAFLPSFLFQNQPPFDKKTWLITI